MHPSAAQHPSNPTAVIVRIECQADRTIVWDSDGSMRELYSGDVLACDASGWRLTSACGAPHTPPAAPEDVPGPATATASITADAIEAYLELHCADATLATVAAHFCCHPNSITRVLKRAGQPPFQALLTRIRMERAHRLLRAGGASVEQVARACGYKNMTHFYRIFRERYGCGPGEVRREALLR